MVDVKIRYSSFIGISGASIPNNITVVGMGMLDDDVVALVVSES